MVNQKSDEEKSKYAPIEMYEVCKKLKNLEFNIHGNFVCCFAESLANRLEGKGAVRPQVFYGTALKLLDDIMNCQDLIDKEVNSIPEFDVFANLDHVFYGVLRSYIPTIAYAACPQGFAEAVEDSHRIRNNAILIFGKL